MMFKETVGIRFEIHKKSISVAKGYFVNDGRWYIYLKLGFKHLMCTIYTEVSRYGTQTPLIIPIAAHLFKKFAAVV